MRLYCKEWPWYRKFLGKGGGEGNGSVLGLEIGYGPSEGGARGQRCENAGVLESGQALVIGF